jgi:hypothetical protein
VARCRACWDGLDEIDWSRLTHAYGAATDVPDQIRALRSPDADLRRRALWKLYGNIFHQGTRYEATAYAVPFLLELLGDPSTPERAELLGLLVSIAIGYDSSWLPGGLPIAEHRTVARGGAELLAAAPRPGDDDYDEDDGDYDYIVSLSNEDQNRLFTYVALAAYDAVRRGVALFRSLLSDQDADVRTMAAYALAWFPEEAAGSVPALTDLVAASPSPPSARAAATALVALGLLGAQPPADAIRDPRPVVRLGAALALARVKGSDVDQAAVDELLAWTSNGDDGLPYLDGDQAGYASLALRQAGPAHADVVFDALLARIPTVSGTAAMPVVSEALGFAFHSGPVPEGTPYAALDERQRRVVQALAASPQTWQFNGMSFGNFAGLVRGYGLPASHAECVEYAQPAG